jgi:4-amino-4-deoxy-L-arabinose transferase-like glycosyltransferase
MIGDRVFGLQSRRLAAALATRPRLRAVLPALALFGLSVLLRLPFVPTALVNWDAVQFALATRSFDLERHQPHPPGYILYVSWGRLLSWATGDANLAIALTSLVAGSLAVALLYLLGREMIGGRSALVAAALFATSPLLWYYSVVALTYAVEAFFLLLVAWLSWRVITSRESGMMAVPSRLATRDARLVVWSAIALGLAGGVRQSTLVLLFPLWLFAAARAGRRPLRRGLAALGVTCLLWLLPLVYLAGGPVQYVRTGLDLFLFVGERTSVLYGGLRAVLGNLAHVGAGLLIGLNLSLVVFALCLIRPSPTRTRITRRQWGMLALWAGPALAVFVFGHIGQVGYLLLVMPALCLVLAVQVEALGQRLTRPLRLAPGPATALVVAVLAAAHVGTVLGAPATAHALLRDPVAAAMVDVRDNDRFWQEITSFVGRFNPEDAIVIAEASPWGSFRHAGYYLPNYRVYGVGNDRRGRFGWLFQAYRGATNYSVEGLARARRTLPRPYDARLAIILDPQVARTLVQRELLVETIATPYRSVYVLDLSRVDLLSFGYGQTFLHGPTLASRDAIPLAIRDIRLQDEDVD